MAGQVCHSAGIWGPGGSVRKKKPGQAPASGPGMEPANLKLGFGFRDQPPPSESRRAMSLRA
jgi:hypothetical protein